MCRNPPLQPARSPARARGGGRRSAASRLAGAVVWLAIAGAAVAAPPPAKPASPPPAARPGPAPKAAKPPAPAARPQTGTASYFSPAEAGKTTASGDPARPESLTAASKSLPLGSKAKVTDEDTGKSVRVTVTDRGPYVPHRIIDVSPKAARALGMSEKGVAPVKVQPLRTAKSAH